MIYIVSFLCTVVGLVVGWLGAERYIAYMQHVEHDFEELFKENPHPEIFKKDGKVNRGDYMTIQFEPGFDPDDWNPESDIHLNDDML